MLSTMLRFTFISRYTAFQSNTLTKITVTPIRSPICSVLRFYITSMLMTAFIIFNSTMATIILNDTIISI